MSKLLIILLFLLFTLCVSQKKFLKKNNEAKEPIFLSKIQTQEYLENDKDNFVKSLNKINFIARKSKNYKEYITRISKNSMDFSEKEKEKILDGYLEACRKLLNCSNGFLNKYGFKREKLKELLDNKTFSIKIALTKDKEYEYGMPHTRENIIFLTTYYLKNNINNSLKLSRTFIHEITHLYQRCFREDYNRFLKEKGWTIVSLNAKKYSRKRINPDLDDNIWRRKNKIYISEFSSNTPQSLEDVKNTSSNDEHPYEYYAYKISNLLVL